MPQRIAIVEDYPVIRANYADVLKKHGYAVDAYADRREALAACRSRLPDLVLLDIGLGDEVDGGIAHGGRRLRNEGRESSPSARASERSLPPH